MDKTQYRQNNILFRIASADAISKFKNIQAHTFIQIVRKEIAFDVRVRESLLAAYCVFSKWILTCEDKFLAQKENCKLGSRFAMNLSKCFAQQLDEIFHIYEQHGDVFSPDVSRYLKSIFKYSKIAFAARCQQEIPVMTSSEGFNFLAQETSIFLQHLLLVLYEYDNNVIKGKPAIINFSQFDLMHCVQYKTKTALCVRILFFKQNYNIHSFVIKNYADLTELPSFEEDIETIRYDNPLTREEVRDIIKDISKSEDVFLNEEQIIPKRRATDK